MKTPGLLYKAHRRLFAITGGKWNDFLSAGINFVRPKRKLKKTDGLLAHEPLDEVLKKLKQDGFYACQTVLSEERVNSIVKQARKRPLRYATIEGNKAKYSDDMLSYKDSSTIDSSRFQFDSKDVFEFEELNEIIFDRSLLNIAQEYLGALPHLDLVTMWWSRTSANKELEDFTAQMYHFDMDRIKFLKFFIYLTDVEEENGPHCYVRGSHKELKKAFRGRGRFEDEEVVSQYGEDNVLHLKGKRGSVLIVDTRGLHKGKKLEKGERLLFQVQFSNSLFGQNYKLIPVSEKTKEKIQEFPEVYGGIFS